MTAGSLGGRFPEAELALAMRTPPPVPEGEEIELQGAQNLENLETAALQIQLEPCLLEKWSLRFLRRRLGGLRRRSPAPENAIDEDTGYPRVLQEASTLQERKLSLFLAVVSMLDIISSFVMMCIAFQYAYRAVGASLYCLGFQSLSHMLSSILLTLRFVGELRVSQDAEEELLRSERKRFLLREQLLNVLMGLSLLVAAAALVFKAARKIRFWDKWYTDHQDMDKEAQWATEFLAWYGFGFYLLQVMGIAASYEKEWSWKVLRRVKHGAPMRDFNSVPQLSDHLCMVSLNRLAIEHDKPEKRGT
eukprot:Skav223093  [mRNA]  locus=scaffold419:482651:489867:+ [translate_table: standard]